MKLYTKTGDDGTTGLLGGKRVKKSHLRVCAYGEVDELNASLGVAIAAGSDTGMVASLTEIQGDLFVIGAELADPEGKYAIHRVGDADVSRLEGLIDLFDDRAPALQSFVLPGGTPLAAALHLARVVCRRAERTMVALGETETVSAAMTTYMNRLSDLLFAMARAANHEAGVPDTPWIAPKDD